MLTSSFRLIQTQRLFRQVIPRRLIRPCAAAAADLDKFTTAAFAAILAVIAKVTKHLGGLPDFPETLLLHIPAVQFKITAGLNLSDMGYKTKRDSSQAAAG